MINVTTRNWPVHSLINSVITKFFSKLISTLSQFISIICSKTHNGAKFIFSNTVVIRITEEPHIPSHKMLE